MSSLKTRKSKHAPQRTCVGCRAVLQKNTLIRIVRTSEGVRVDSTGKLPGRGTYLHPIRACWQRAMKGALSHALKTNLSEMEIDQLQAYMDTLPDEEAV